MRTIHITIRIASMMLMMSVTIIIISSSSSKCLHVKLMSFVVMGLLL